VCRPFRQTKRYPFVDDEDLQEARPHGVDHRAVWDISTGPNLLWIKEHVVWIISIDVILEVPSQAVSACSDVRVFEFDAEGRGRKARLLHGSAPALSATDDAEVQVSGMSTTKPAQALPA
jgi:hypothetical protein